MRIIIDIMRASSVSNAILDLLDGHHTHLTAAQVYDQIRQNLTAVNRSTVYRSLKRLVDAGEVTISDMGMEALVYERRTDTPHHHLVCHSCGKILMIADEQVRDFFGNVESRYPFRVITDHLILYGICADCAKK